MNMKVTDDQLKAAVANSISIMEVLRKIGIKPAGGSHSHYKRRIDALGIDTTHFKGVGWKSGKSDSKRQDASQILILRNEGVRQKSHRLVRALIESGVKHECSKCGQPPEWLGNPLTLDVDHINENWLDDRIENLRFLCPNCHSQFSRKLI